MTRRLQVLFLLALLGVLGAAGLVVADLGGTLPATAYAAVALGGLLYAAGRARSAAAAAPPGRTCTCCTSTVHDPVEVR